jgi:nicotinamidase-related amidase
MIEYKGKIIPTSLEELIDPKHTALLIIDIQNDLCLKKGTVEKYSGIGIPEFENTVNNVKNVADVARKVKIPVIYTRATHLKDQISDSAELIVFRMKMYNLKKPYNAPTSTIKGTWGHEILEELKPFPEDIIIDKNRTSAFTGTNLDLILRNNKIKTLVVTGVVTWGCVFDTVRAGVNLDYFMVILRDCVNAQHQDLHNAALKIMTHRHDVIDSKEAIKTWLN